MVRQAAAWRGLTCQKKAEPMPTNPPPDHDPLLGIQAVMKLSSLSRSTIQRQIKVGRFPPSVRVTPGGRVAWRQSQVLAWVAAPLDWGVPIDF